MKSKKLPTFIARSATALILMLLFYLLFYQLPLIILPLIILLVTSIILLVELPPLLKPLSWPMRLVTFCYILAGMLSLFFLSLNNRFLLVLIIITAAIHDTSAYLIGSLLGRHKLAPLISPGKTVEGFFGGIIGCFFLFLILIPEKKIFLLGEAIVLAGAIALVATAGDLALSYLKRKAGIKDSGSLLPGHGGLLDRFDSIIPLALISTFYLAYTLFQNN